MSCPSQIVSAAQPPRLLDQLRDRLRLRHYSLRTEQAYIHWVKRYILFHGKRHPTEMGKAEVEAFLTHLAVEPIILKTSVDRWVAIEKVHGF
jgi:hypothetical protein